MSTVPSTSTSQSNFVPIFNAALESYERKTKKDLTSHPLLSSLQSCSSPEAVLAVLRDQIPAFGQSQNRDDALTKWVAPTVNVLYTFSTTVGQGIGLVNTISLIFRGMFLILHLFLGNTTCKCNLCRDQRSPLGRYPLFVTCANHLDNGAPRRLEMPALAKTSSSIFLTALNGSSTGLRYTLGSHRLPQ